MVLPHRGCDRGARNGVAGLNQSDFEESASARTNRALPKAGQWQ